MRYKSGAQKRKEKNELQSQQPIKKIGTIESYIITRPSRSPKPSTSTPRDSPLTFDKHGNISNSDSSMGNVEGIPKIVVSHSLIRSHTPNALNTEDEVFLRASM